MLQKKKKIIKINDLKQDLRIETLNRRMKQKPISNKMKNKEITKRKTIELQIEIKMEAIIKTVNNKSMFLHYSFINSKHINIIYLTVYN